MEGMKNNEKREYIGKSMTISLYNNNNTKKLKCY